MDIVHRATKRVIYRNGSKTYRDTVESAIGEGVSLAYAALGGVVLYKADLSDADLRHAELSGADLNRADLSGAQLSDADLSHANLCSANLSRANLHHANLSRAEVRDANFRGADLTLADLRGADLSVAHTDGADLWKAILVDDPDSSTESAAVAPPSGGHGRYAAPDNPHASCRYVGRCVPRMLDSSADKCEQP